jgi:predicted DCC family thiol-disulfide oxidoreductase YuxK
MSGQEKAPTAYFDGGCPLCRAEIATYRRSPGGANINWCDVTQSSPSELGPDLDPQAALKRFYVRKSDGSLVSGAEGFVEVWGHLDNWRWLAALARIPGMIYVMEKSYLLFLRVRPLWRR